LSPFYDKRITVAGLGHFGGGVAVSRWLAAQGGRVLVTDRDPAEKFEDQIKQLAGLSIEFRLGEHREPDFTSADLVVVNPAIPPTNEYLKAAVAAGVPVTTEIGLFIERCPATILGVTGTKGKSTTSKLLSLMLGARFKVWTGGNIGVSLLGDLPQIRKTDLVVLELSSFMLEHLRPMQWSPHVAVVNMIAVDHIAWHGSEEAYVDAKRNIVRFQRPNDVAVLSEENDRSASFSRDTLARIVKYGTSRRRAFELTIPGHHNQLNAQAAFAAADVMGIDWDDAQRAVRDFPGLPHRLQLVHTTRDGVRFFNDSIATIPEAAVAALDSFPAKRVIQIVGGSDKGLSITAMCAALCERAKAVLCVGQMGVAVEKTMSESPLTQRAGVYACGDLPTAVKLAREIAVPGDVVLLSPGFASYDQFTNFQERGDQFASLARQGDS
jgi:UDP-N-acetylmuramoylalanine--D-glutamate ligase